MRKRRGLPGRWKMDGYEMIRPVPLPPEPATRWDRPSDTPCMWLMSEAELGKYLREHSKRVFE